MAILRLQQVVGHWPWGEMVRAVGKAHLSEPLYLPAHLFHLLFTLKDTSLSLPLVSPVFCSWGWVSWWGLSSGRSSSRGGSTSASEKSGLPCSVFRSWRKVWCLEKRGGWREERVTQQDHPRPATHAPSLTSAACPAPALFAASGFQVPHTAAQTPV